MILCSVHVQVLSLKGDIAGVIAAVKCLQETVVSRLDRIEGILDAAKMKVVAIEIV